MKRMILSQVVLTTLLSTSSLFGATFTVSNGLDSGAGSLRQAILDANTAGGSNTITISNAVPVVTIISDLPAIANSQTLSISTDLASTTINTAGGNHRAFQTESGTNVTINDIVVFNTGSTGGSGVDGGGGASGRGGGLLVKSGSTVILNDCRFANCRATGGDGGDGSTALDGGGGGGGTTDNGAGPNVGVGGTGGALAGGGGGGIGGAGGDLGGFGFPGRAGGLSGGALAGAGEAGTTGNKAPSTNLGGDGGKGGNGGNGAIYGAGGAGGAGGNGGFGITTIGNGGNGGDGGAGGRFAGGGGGGRGGTGDSAGTGGIGGADGTQFGSKAGNGSALASGGGSGGDGLGGAIFVEGTGNLTITSNAGAPVLFDTNFVFGGSGGAGVSGSGFGQDGTGTSPDLFIDDGSVITIWTDTTQTISTSIDSFFGTVTLTKQGVAPLVFSGTTSNGYFGLTTINEGELQLNKTGAQAIIGNVLINPTAGVVPTALTSVQSGQFGVTTTITNNGGTFNLGTSNELIGRLNFNAGTVTGTLANLSFDDATTALVMGSNTTMPSGVNIFLFGGSVEFNGTTGPATINSNIDLFARDTTFNIANGSVNPGMIVTGNITNGSLTKMGPGTLSLSGNNTLTNTTITEGTLNLDNGTISGNVNVAAGTNLTGVGTVGSVVSDGAVAPGTSPGTLNVTDFTFNAGSSYDADITPTASDLILASSSVTINDGATLNIIPEVGEYTVGSSFTIIDAPANQLTGSFSSVTNSFPLLAFQLIYDRANGDLIIQIGQESFVVAVGPSGNIGQVAKCLDAIVAGGNLPADFQQVLDVLLNSTVSELRASLNQMNASLYNVLNLNQQSNMFAVRDILTSRLDVLCKESSICNKWTLWVSPFHTWTHQEAPEGFLGFKSKTSGVVGGVDTKYGDKKVVGMNLGFSSSRLAWDSPSFATFNSGYAGLYLHHRACSCCIDAGINFALSGYSTTRNITIANATETIIREAKGTHCGFTYDAYLKASSSFEKDRIEIMPFVGVDWTSVRRSGFTEAGAESLDLVVSPTTANMLRMAFGTSVKPCINEMTKKCIPEFGLSIVREQRFAGRNNDSSFVISDCVMDIEGLNPSRTLLSAKGSITVQCSKMARFGLNYEGEFQISGDEGNYRSHNVFLQLTADFPCKKKK